MRRKVTCRYFKNPKVNRMDLFLNCLFYLQEVVLFNQYGSCGCSHQNPDSQGESRLEINTSTKSLKLSYILTLDDEPIEK